MIVQHPPSQAVAVEAKTLIIYDDADAASVWSSALLAAGIDASLVHIGSETMHVWAEMLPDLIVLEDFNQELEELGLCARLRHETPVPILLLTARIDAEFHMRAYEAGVDECIALSVHPRLFAAKVRAWLRRTLTLPTTALGEVGTGSFRLEPAVRRLTTGWGKTFRLTNLEMRLLLVLIMASGRSVDQDVLIQRVWGPYGGGDMVMLKNVVYRLRRKIEPEPRRPRYLVTIDQTSYRLAG